MIAVEAPSVLHRVGYGPHTRGVLPPDFVGRAGGQRVDLTLKGGTYLLRRGRGQQRRVVVSFPSPPAD